MDRQVAVFTTAVAVVCCTIMTILYYNVTHYDMIRSLADRVRSLQSYVVSNLDKEAFLDINTPEDIDTELYTEVHDIFKKAQDVSGVMYLYSGKRNAQGDLVYVVDCIDPSAEDFRNPGDLIEEDIVPEMERALDGEEVLPHRIKNTDWGKIFIAYLPVEVDGEIVGVIGVEFEAKHQYNTFQFLVTATPIVAGIVCVICSLVAKYLFRRISNPLYKDMFNTDYLTNLKSRNAFEVDVENLGSMKKHNQIGIYVIDLNNLKMVNDTYGHEAGDLYLQTAARSFQGVAGDGASVYRMGGDEFVLIALDDTQDRMERRSEDLISVFDQNKPEWEMELSFCIGCTLYDPDQDASLYDTYKRADRMMYEKKHEFHAQNPQLIRSES